MSSVILHSGYTVLCCADTGQIDGQRDGLFDFDTRILSRWRLTLDGSVPELVEQSVDESDRWRAVLRVPMPGSSAVGPRLPQDAIEIELKRDVGPSMREAIGLRNWSACAFQGRLTLELDADFGDISRSEEDGWRNELTIDREWSEATRILDFRAVARRGDRRFERGLSVRITSTVPVAASGSALAFDIPLAPGGGEQQDIELAYVSVVDGRERVVEPENSRRRRQRVAWRARRATVDGPPRLKTAFDRAADDLFDLRNWELEQQYLGRDDGRGWVMNAGVPTFTGFFGRDALTSAWQSSLLGPRAALGALTVTAATQAHTDDPWRDAEPGKMIHELRRGPVAMLGVGPRDAYYGSQTTPHMFVLALSEAWHWTADIELLRRYRDPALRALEWAHRYGDVDGDGLLEYQRRSPKGLANQGWKDSDEAIRHADGSNATGPIATVEEQAFYFIALQRMAEILIELGEPDHATTYIRRAADLARRWHEAFWMPEEGYYAMALDGEKRQVKSIGSNAGHALGCGIVPPEHAQTVADRLLADDLFSGWGVRTLSDRHPSYNPFAYHLGSVWPVEQATFALGLKRYGLDEHADRLIGSMLDAAAAAPDDRLPEALSGHSRGTLRRPIPYPDANNPQAWSASAVIQMIQIMLGLYPLAPLGVLALVHPRLPEWLPELTVRRLRVGSASVDIRFTRQLDGSATHEVLRRRGRLIVAGAGPPHEVTRSRPFGESVMQAVLSVLPGERLRAVRIALGIEPA